MKQTAVEWIIDEIASKNDDGFYIIDSLDDVVNVFKQAKEMENQQQDEFAINFLEWFDENCYARGESSFLLWDNDDEPLTPKELLEKFKNK
jgi:hypothetical protein